MANAQASSSRQAGRNRVDLSPEEGDIDDERLTKPVAGDAIEHDEDQLHLWTVDSYTPQTKQRDPFTDVFFKKLTKDIGEMIENIDSGIARVTETATAIEESSPGDDMIEELAKGVCRSLEMKHVLELKAAVIKSIQTRMNRGEDITDPARMFEKETSDKTEAYMKKTPRQKFSNDDDYSHFRNEVWSQSHSNQACPPMSHWLDKEEGDLSDDDDDVEVGPTLQNYKCAASHMPIKDAMVNPACKHHFSKQMITQLFEQAGRGKTTITCPSVGCGARIVKSELKADPTFQARADQHFMRETQREEQVEDFEDFTQDDD